MQDNQDVSPTTRPLESPAPAATASAAPPAAPSPAPATQMQASNGGWRVPGWILLLLVVLAAGGVASSGLLWQRVNQMQSDVARRSADSNSQSIEARTLSQQSQTLSLDNAARLGVLENQVKDLGLQRAQLESLVNQISRVQDGSVVAEVNASIRLAQQQMMLTGSTAAMIASLNQAKARLEKAALPQLGNLQRAIGEDIGRLQSADTVDVQGIQSRMDSVLGWADNLPLLNSVTDMRGSGHQPSTPQGQADALANASPFAAWWRGVWTDMRQLVRVSRLDRPDAALIAPDQAYFLRENIKLRLLDARVSLAARQYGQARQDLVSVSDLLKRYFDTNFRLTQQAVTALEQMQAEVHDVKPPSIDATMAALSAAMQP